MIVRGASIGPIGPIGPISSEQKAIILLALTY